MYLSRIKLDIKKRPTMIALSTPSMFHGAIESSFLGERPHCLWRIDVLYGEYYLLILSEEKPDFSNVVAEYGTSGSDEVHQYDNFLSHLEKGSKWQFKLCANPTYCVTANEKGKRGRLCAHTTVDKQRGWLKNQAEAYGFAIEADEFEIVTSRWYQFGKKKQKVSLLAVTYEGLLTVLDKDKFLKGMTNGIGRGKAYGMGLLTIMSPGR